MSYCENTPLVTLINLPELRPTHVTHISREGPGEVRPSLGGHLFILQSARAVKHFLVGSPFNSWTVCSGTGEDGQWVTVGGRDPWLLLPNLGSSAGLVCVA